MRGLIDGLFWFLRRGPISLGIAAIVILAAGFYLQKLDNERNAARAAALAAGPPDAVDIAKFDRDQHMNGAREVVVMAQPVFDVSYELTLMKDSGDDHVFMLPLIAAKGTDAGEIVGIAYYPSQTENFANITDDLLLMGAKDFGVVGPLVPYNGALRGMGQWDDLTEEAFADEGLVMPANPVIVWPYMNGRAEALAPPSADEFTIFGVLSKVAGAIGLLALIKLAVRSGGGSAPKAPAMPERHSEEPHMQAAPMAAAATSDVPLWKQRAGLVDTSANAPATFEPASFDTTPQSAAQPARPSYESLAVPARRPFSIRKVLIGIVGAMFVIGLVAVLADLWAKAEPAATTAEIVTSQERLAQSAAEAIVPDADPNRHWTDIDVTPIIEWLVAEFFLALAGDADAQVNLGLIFGGLFVVSIMIRWFFTMRRALAPRTTARFSSMGLD